MKHYDLVIVGGGMVGKTLAACLKDTGLNIALIDAAVIDPSNDKRLIALNHASCSLYKNIGLWPLLKSNATPINEVHVSKKGRFGITRINKNILNIDALGHVVPAKYINLALQEFLADSKDLTFLNPATLTNISQSSQKVEIDVSIDSGILSLTCDRVVAADGTNSTIRQALNIDVETIDYEQTALVTSTVLQRSHHNIAYERFIDDGAIAMLPLADNKVATIWTASNAKVKQLLSIPDDEFIKELQDNFGYRLGKLIQVSQRASYPLKMTRALQQNKNNVCLIGNAAHTIHPVAAQGLNLAMYEIAIIVDALKDSDPELLKALDKKKFSEKLSHQLTWVFSNENFIFNKLRQASMVGLDVIKPLKLKFAEHAIGKGGVTPSLLIENGSF